MALRNPCGVDGVLNLKEIILTSTPFVVGRLETCNAILRIESHKGAISREHATFRFSKEGGWTISDSSLNGVFVNSARVPRTPLALNNGDQISFGMAGGKILLQYDFEFDPNGRHPRLKKEDIKEKEKEGEKQKEQGGGAAAAASLPRSRSKKEEKEEEGGGSLDSVMRTRTRSLTGDEAKSTTKTTTVAVAAAAVVETTTTAKPVRKSPFVNAKGESSSSTTTTTTVVASSSTTTAKTPASPAKSESSPTVSRRASLTRSASKSKEEESVSVGGKRKTPDESDKKKDDSSSSSAAAATGGGGGAAAATAAGGGKAWGSNTIRMEKGDEWWQVSFKNEHSRIQFGTGKGKAGAKSEARSHSTEAKAKEFALGRVAGMAREGFTIVHQGPGFAAPPPKPDAAPGRKRAPPPTVPPPLVRHVAGPDGFESDSDSDDDFTIKTRKGGGKATHAAGVDAFSRKRRTRVPAADPAPSSAAAAATVGGDSDDNDDDTSHAASGAVPEPKRRAVTALTKVHPAAAAAAAAATILYKCAMKKTGSTPVEVRVVGTTLRVIGKAAAVISSQSFGSTDDAKAAAEKTVQKYERDGYVRA